MKKTMFDGAAILCIASAVSVPAAAGMLGPAPVAGVGMGALFVLGIGYRALRKRIDG